MFIHSLSQHTLVWTMPHSGTTIVFYEDDLAQVWVGSDLGCWINIMGHAVSQKYIFLCVCVFSLVISVYVITWIRQRPWQRLSN